MSDATAVRGAGSSKRRKSDTTTEAKEVIQQLPKAKSDQPPSTAQSPEPKPTNPFDYNT